MINSLINSSLATIYIFFFFFSFSLAFLFSDWTCWVKGTLIRIYPKILTYAYIFLCVVSHYWHVPRGVFLSLRVAHFLFSFFFSRPLNPAWLFREKRSGWFPCENRRSFISTRIMNCPGFSSEPLSSRADFLAGASSSESSRLSLSVCILRMCAVACGTAEKRIGVKYFQSPLSSCRTRKLLLC